MGQCEPGESLELWHMVFSHCVGMVNSEGLMTHEVEFCLQVDCNRISQTLTISQAVCLSQVANDYTVTLRYGWLILKFTVIRPYPKK